MELKQCCSRINLAAIYLSTKIPMTETKESQMISQIRFFLQNQVLLRMAAETAALIFILNSNSYQQIFFFLILLRKYAKVLYFALSDDEALQVTGSGSKLLLQLLCLLFLCCFIDYAKKIDQSHSHKTNYYHCTDLRYYISILLENLSRSDKTKDKSIISLLRFYVQAAS